MLMYGKYVRNILDDSNFSFFELIVPRKFQKLDSISILFHCVLWVKLTSDKKVPPTSRLKLYELFVKQQ